jgi:hypothetical protein
MPNDPDVDLPDDTTIIASNPDYDSSTTVDTDELDVHQIQWVQKMLLTASRLINMVVNASGETLQLYSDTYYNKQPYHTSALSGIGWVNELLTGHPDRIQCELGVCRHVFYVLLNLLRNSGCKASKYVLLKEQLAIFLYASVTGLSVHHSLIIIDKLTVF